MAEQISLLYVDDESINLKLFELNFKSKFRVVTALSGDDGLAILENDPTISVVISDMRMPKMDGLEFIAKAKQSFPYIVYYILTGFDITDEINEALSKNLINKYFRKPFNFREIEGAITSALD
jgi:response regulator RpfG family c-di-GMP phosphodiesterase